MNTAETQPTNVCALAAAVAALMPGWKLGETSRDRGDTSRDGWAHIEHTSGAELSLSLKTWPKPERIHVSGIWPRRKPNGAYGKFMPKDSAAHSINVGLGKSAAQVARDIARRLEGAYLAEYAVQAERMRSTIAAEGGAAAAAARIASSIGETARKGAGDRHLVYLSSMLENRRGNGDLTIDPAGEGEPAYCNLELRGLTPDETIKILKLLRGGLEGTAVEAIAHIKETTPHA
jgi:hypothetical protein